MALKAVEMVSKIRDKHYEETKDLSIEEQIFYIKEKAKQFQQKNIKAQQLTKKPEAPMKNQQI